MSIEQIQAAFMRDQTSSDEEIERIHGNHIPYSIARWRAEAKSGKTTLPYIDWRCDKLWCAADNRRSSKRAG